MSVSTEHTHTHTHTAVFHRGAKRIFWRQSYRRRSAIPFPSRLRSADLTRSLGSDRRGGSKRRGKEEFGLAHLKRAPVRRALSATDSVCSLLQDGGSAPDHFLLIASQLSLSIRRKTYRSQTPSRGTSRSISSPTKGCAGRAREPPIARFPAWRSSGGCGAANGGCSDHPTWSSVRVCAPLLCKKRFQTRTRRRNELPTHASSLLRGFFDTSVTVEFSWDSPGPVWIYVKWRISVEPGRGG